ncbi:MAG: type IV secretion system DNA-binding domain-containing protein [Candidatus Nealsonbacteria bacterium]|nr:type IV secretion system DNA-binding domain-containing protein [Candidatus Nealsonbacteria bacterium]
MKEITFFGETTFRNRRRKFGIKLDDRRRHFYAIGKTGVGKTAMMENMAIQDIQNGHGIGFIDPHGEAADNILRFVPPTRINDVIYFNPADLSYPIAFNVMENINPDQRHLISSGLMGVFKKIWPDVWSARMEYILNNTILALLEYPDATLLGINRMFSDSEFRKKVVEKVEDPIIKAFWLNEYAMYSKQYETEATAAIQNKVGQFISNPLIRNIVGQVKSTINIREIMDTRKIFIANISKGRIGEDNSKLLGSLIITKLQLAAMSRVDIPEPKREDFYLYVDEFQNFATSSFATILSEARKYRLSLILGHQYITQMEEEVRDAVFGNMGTITSFRVGPEDAEFLEKEFGPEFMATDLVNLPKYNIYVKLMIDGISGRPFSAETLPPLEPPKEVDVDKIINSSRERYGKSREVTEEKIKKWFGGAVLPVTSLESSLELYDAICSKCDKKTKVTFKPDETRPIYCKSCRKKIQKPSKEEDNKEENVSLDNINSKKPVLFSFFRKNKKEEAEKPKKSVDVNKLRGALQNSLGKIKKKNDEIT